MSVFIKLCLNFSCKYKNIKNVQKISSLCINMARHEKKGWTGNERVKTKESQPA